VLSQALEALKPSKIPVRPRLTNRWRPTEGERPAAREPDSGRGIGLRSSQRFVSCNVDYLNFYRANPAEPCEPRKVRRSRVVELLLCCTKRH